MVSRKTGAGAPHRPGWTLAVLCALAGIAAPARSQQQAPEAQAVDALPGVTVTARKREESAQSVPIGMSVLSGATLSDSAAPADGNAGLARAAPNVSFADSGGQYGNLFIIRGVGAFAPLSSDDTSVVMYFNEVPRSVYGASPTLFDINRVELLRGPQGTLFGRNTQGGAINVTPNTPTFKREFSLTGETGSHGYRLGEAMANGALSDSLAGRVAVRYSRQDGTTANVATGGRDGRVEVGALRGALMWVPDAATTATLTAFYDRRESDAARFVWLQNPAFPQSAVNPQSDVTWRDSGLSLKVEHDFAQTRLTSLSSYQDSKSRQPFDLTDGLLYAAMTGQPQSRYNVPYADYADVNFREKTMQQELRLSSLAEGPLTWTAGVNLFHSRFNNDTTAVASAAAFNFQTQNGTQNNRISTDSAAAFGEGTLALSSKLKASLGLRYTYERKSGDFVFTGNGSPAVVARSQYSLHLSDKFLTGRTGLSYDWTPDLMTYASLARGAVGAGYPVTQTNGPGGKAEVPYATSTSWTYETGFKSMWLERRLGLTGALFHNDVKNGHLIVFDASRALFTTAALDYRSTGAELEGVASLSKTLKLNAAIGYTHSELANVPAGSSTGAKSGNRVPNMPRLTASLGLQYDAPVTLGAAEGKLKANLAWQYTGARAVDVKESFDLPGYSVLNARIGWQHGDWEIYGFAWNLLDKQYLVAGQAWTSTVSSVRVGQPRIVGVGATVHF